MVSILSCHFFSAKHEWQSYCYRLGHSENYSYAETVIMTNSVDMMVTISKQNQAHKCNLLLTLNNYINMATLLQDFTMQHKLVIATKGMA